MPYSLRVDGRQTYIVGYAYTPTGTQEPTVGNDWYPLDLDVFDNVEFASVDAYIASEEGQATLQGCGVSALVPLATATQRLADNDINITVHDIRPLNDRVYSGNGYRYLVDRNGGIVTFSEGDDVSCFYRQNPEGGYASIWKDDLPQDVAAWGTYNVGEWSEGEVTNFTVDGVAYTFTPVGDAYTLTPAAGTYGN